MRSSSLRRTGGFALLALLLVAALFAAGCGSSDDDGGGGSSAAAADAPAPADTTSAGGAATTSEPPAKAATGDPIVIGTICSCTGAVSSTTATDPDTIQAWAKWTNAHGGINGHPVKVIVKDDALNAGTTVKAAHELVEKDKVQAIVGETSNLDFLWAKYVQSKGVPVIGAATFESVYEFNPMFFATGAQNPTMVYGTLAQIKNAGKAKVGLMYCAESPSCAQYAALMTKVGKVLGGLDVVTNQKITATQPNYTAACLSAKSKGADALIILHASAIVTRVTQSCAQQGFTPPQFNFSFTPGVDWQKDPNMQGLLAISPNQSLWDDSVPATQTYNKAMDQYAPGIKDRPEYNPSNASVWGAAEVFRVAAERGKVTPTSTPAAVLNGLYTFKDETVDGLVPPLTYTKGKNNLVGCYFLSAIKDQKWTAPNGGKPVCVPDDVLPQLEALMARS
ncbi:MAG TPA: ABC transporter substrate-binding protein [Baekduia sp.]|uniref:ABC transporter substrate-binding protein n=1 Tax=Baekduia sp. TaxID=2600305 RepID=UPI002D792F07|nr:ABC transporter substrate-binding protein [Baekduia sp.]HET6509073.1 ABC transporter substrate-binding protein [Baekduia sp.]